MYHQLWRKNNENNERKSTILVILVIILSLLILGLGGYIIYDKLNTTNRNA